MLISLHELLCHQHYIQIVHIVCRDAKDLCMASSDISRPEINLHKVMEEMRAGRGGRWNERAKEEGGWKEVPVSLDKEEIQQVCWLFHRSVFSEPNNQTVGRRSM